MRYHQDLHSCLRRNGVVSQPALAVTNTCREYQRIVGICVIAKGAALLPLTLSLNIIGYGNHHYGVTRLPERAGLPEAS